MTYSDLLISTCTVTRYAPGAIDAYGNPTKAWANHLVGQKCRISYPKGKQIQRGTEVVSVDAMLFMENVDVTVHDRVIVDTITYEILFVADPQDAVGNHHKELSLVRVIA